MADSLIIVFLIYTIGLWLVLGCYYNGIIRFLQNMNMVSTNYQGKRIPIAVGIMIPIIQVLSVPWSFFEGAEKIYLIQTLFTWLIAYVGWRDDRYGGREAKGIKGHFSLWWNTGTCSTGWWKAVVGSWVAFVIASIYSTSIWEWFLHVSLIILLTNQINLFDLRPGRAIKGFLFLFVLILVNAYSKIPVILWLPLVVTVIFLFKEDIQGKAMLGDTGSNTLGFTLALWVVIYGTLGLKICILLSGLLVQLYAEKKSISSLIQRDRKSVV